MAYMTADRRDRGGDRDRPQDRWEREQTRDRGSRHGWAAQAWDGAPAAGRPGTGPGARACAAYDGSTASIAAARAFAAAFLDREAGARGPAVPAEVISAVQLVVSELVTNACKFAPGPSALTLEVHDRALEITVWDGEPSLPVLSAAEGAAEPDRIGRHGLELVLALCTRFDVHPEPVGKRVTATVDLLPPAPPGR
jgi:anti-sigma regulatory factor (Ser/Thr protein kinase)